MLTRRIIMQDALDRIKRRRVWALRPVVWLGLLSAVFLAAHPLSAQDVPVDFGDAPESYRTRAENKGPFHGIVEEFHLGKFVDVDKDGKPSNLADGDDLTPEDLPDDEDGVRLLDEMLIPGQPAAIEVFLTGSDGRLDAWIDFNRDGDFADEQERIFRGLGLVSESNSLKFEVPDFAEPGRTYARFRLSFEGGLEFVGGAETGEVEDHAWLIGKEQTVSMDLGDASQRYPTLRSDDGARHVIVDGLNLGEIIDGEEDGRPSSNAQGDDEFPAGAPDDEDGVRFLTDTLMAGQDVEIEALVTGEKAFLDAWVDFNQDGDWTDDGEQVLVSASVTKGVNPLDFTVPDSLEAGETFARFRLSQRGELRPFGRADSGEVEDYLVKLEEGQPVENFDFGDAPQQYPTLESDGGARHRIVDGFHLGELVDPEEDGQPGSDAQGDDINPAGAADDEDGVNFVSPPLAAGSEATVEVILTGKDGWLDAWVDFNRDGDWQDDLERIFIAEPLASGLNTLRFDVPAEINSGETYARFRLSRSGELRSSGLASDGEVEDYAINLGRAPSDCVPRTNEGRDFWLTFPGNYAPDADNPVKLSLCITGPRGAEGTVTIRGLEFTVNFAIGASRRVDVALPTDAELGHTNDEISKKGIHVKADQEVAVFGLNRVRYTTDGFLGYPTDVLGTRYLVQSYPNVQSEIPEMNGTQFGLVATQDETRVTITPSVKTQGHPTGVPFSMTLNEGETYQLRHRGDSPGDLTGTLVEADKPIALFGSHQCAFINANDDFFCDYLVEQALPLSQAGARFISYPLATRSNGDTFRMVGLTDGTTVAVNGGVVATINQGEVHERLIDGAAEITSSHPILVSQFSNSADFDGVDDSDPFMMTLLTPSQYRNEYTLCVPDSGFNVHYVNVIAPNAAVGSIRLDGNPIPAGQYSAIGGTGFSGAQVAVLPGAHRLIGKRAFGVSVYGFARYDSYGYPGGMLFGDTTPPELVCPQEEILVEVTPNSEIPCRTIVPDLRRKVQITDNCDLPDDMSVTQTPEPGTAVGVGTHEITLSGADARGNIGRCTVKFIVMDPSPLSIECPGDMVTQCETREGRKVFFDVETFKACDPNVTVECMPASGSLFPVGTTEVTCVATDTAGNTAECSFSVTVECDSEQKPIEATINADGLIEVRWIEGRTLESAPTVSGPWTAIENAESPFVEEIKQDQNKFYRIR